jgi:hypothetical protein
MASRTTEEILRGLQGTAATTIIGRGFMTRIKDEKEVILAAVIIHKIEGAQMIKQKVTIN